MASTPGTVIRDIDNSIVQKMNESPHGRGNVYRATTSGAQTLPRYVDTIELVHATKIEITIPDLSYHSGKFYVRQMGSGTAGHTVTATIGEFQASVNVLTLNAAEEAYECMIDSMGNGSLTINTGTVGTS
jgi:hypothetical protein